MFEIGRLYNRRRDIHERFEGQRQGGMSTPAEHPLIFLFTGEGGAAYGYRDEFRPDGTFWYTGEGQRGDMEFVRANRALRDHRQDGKQVHLFEKIDDGVVRYIGEVEYLGYHFEERPDLDDQLRRAIVFELALTASAIQSDTSEIREPVGSYSTRHLRSKTAQEMRRLAIEDSSASASNEERRRNVYVRSEAVRAYVLNRAGGKCEGCSEEAPFRTKQGQPYLEPHHTRRIADGGPDHPDYVIALCPTCRRRVHYSCDGEEYNAELIEWLATKK